MSWAEQIDRERTAAVRRASAELRRQEADARRRARDAKQAHVETRLEEADEKNDALAAQLTELERLLSDGVTREWSLDLQSLKLPLTAPPFDPRGADKPASPPDLQIPKPPGWFARLVPGSSARYQRLCDDAKSKHEQAMHSYEASEDVRIAGLNAARARYDADTQRLIANNTSFNREIDSLIERLRAGEQEAIAEYFSLVLHRDALPEGFPDNGRVTYQAESQQLVVERQLPTIEIIPAANAYRYVRARDEITSSARPASQIRILYTETIARLALRTLHGMLAADSMGLVQSIVLNGYVDTVDPASGMPVSPCLLTVRVTRDGMRAVDLARVEPIACLRALSAEISRSPHELVPVRPLIDFDMADHRFVDKPDVLAALDDRPNLAELSPGEFEGLITNLFEKMGLETRLTQASRDGGVDCVAWDMRPVVGGKVIVQAKRYKNTVGVSAVRDLYGTVMNEGAAKGILVTTSGYGKAAYDFASNKPLELLSGSNLLYLLEEHAGIRGRIVFPTEWVDPVPDHVDPSA